MFQLHCKNLFFAQYFKNKIQICDLKVDYLPLETLDFPVLTFRSISNIYKALKTILSV